jgi:hypothetical protein
MRPVRGISSEPLICAAFAAMAMAVLASCGGGGSDGATPDRAKDLQIARAVEQQIKHSEKTAKHLSNVIVRCVRSGKNRLHCNVKARGQGRPVRTGFQIVIDPTTRTVRAVEDRRPRPGQG